MKTTTALAVTIMLATGAAQADGVEIYVTDMLDSIQNGYCLDIAKGQGARWVNGAVVALNMEAGGRMRGDRASAVRTKRHFANHLQSFKQGRKLFGARFRLWRKFQLGHS